MTQLILLIPLIVLLSCCKTQTLSTTSNERIIHGYSYDNTTGEGLNGTFVYNLTQGMMTVADSTGRFKLTVKNRVIRTHPYDTIQTVNGWYPVADFPENEIEGKAFVTTKDFAEVSLDTISFSDMAIIEGRLKAEKIQKWADATESRIGKRIGFVFNDSVITAPTVNCRIESGSFSINSPDKALILEIYNSLKEQL